MSEAFKVFVVDDDPFVLDVVRNLLAPDYAVDTFASSEACLAQLEVEKPGMILLDVRLPGMDGYTFCRQIKDTAGLSDIPVTFISSHDTIDARLRGYDAGGEDFIVKPFQPEEVRRKVRVAEQIGQSQRMLKEQMADAELLSSLVMANIDEYAILLQYLRQLISWGSEQEIADGMLDLLRRFKLQGVAQTRISGRTLTLSAAGKNLPLETSVLDHVRGMGRIFDFRNRSVHNFDRVTLMISNMPLHDSEFCGRLRDHLSMAAESTEARLQAIETEETVGQSQSGIGEVLSKLGSLAAEVHEAHLRDRTLSADLLLRLEHDLAKSFVSLGMSDEQEHFLDTLVRNFVAELIELFDRGEETQQALQELSERLARLHRSG